MTPTLAAAIGAIGFPVLLIGVVFVACYLATRN
jgi:hypothetical protein